MPEVFDASTASVGDVLLELLEDLVLELELLGDRLEHEVGALERRREVGLEAERPAVLLRRVEPVEHALRHRHAALRALERLLGLTSYSAVSMPARASTAPMPGPHRPGADHRCASYLGHVPSSFSSWIRRQTRSGVNGSSVIGTPASARAVATAAVTAASDPSPQPFAP